jgi:tRNA A58 N-methylase Trm61
MSSPKPFPVSIALAGALALALLPTVAPAQGSASFDRTPDVIYVPTPQEVVEKMIEMARVGPGDVVYDLGSGDGRLVIAAAKAGAREAIGIDIDPERVAEARDNVLAAGVEDRVKIIEGDLFQMDLSGASVITLYLLPELNLMLRPKLLAMKPGTRIVSHAFAMGDWEPDQTEEVDGRRVYKWTVPPRGRSQARTGR